MPRMSKISSAVFLAIGIMCRHAAAAHPNVAARGPALFEQAERLPADFVEQLFDSPLVVRVDFDGRSVGDATVTLSRDGKIQLVTLSDEQRGNIAQGDRELIEKFLREPRPLGTCENNCEGVLALHYNLQDSVLSIVTGRAEQGAEQKKYHALPASGSHGLITYNYLNLTGGQGREVTGSRPGEEIVVGAPQGGPAGLRLLPNLRARDRGGEPIDGPAEAPLDQGVGLVLRVRRKGRGDGVQRKLAVPKREA